MTWGNGAKLLLIPAGPDRFANGVGSEMRFQRDAAGRVTGATRGQGVAVWWKATRL